MNEYFKSIFVVVDYFWKIALVYHFLKGLQLSSSLFVECFKHRGVLASIEYDNETEYFEK